MAILKKLIVLLAFIILSFSCSELCYASELHAALNAGESYVFTNNSTEDKIIQLSNPYISKGVYDYVIYTKDGLVLGSGMSKNNAEAFKVPGRGRLAVTIMSAIKPIEFISLGDAFTSKVSSIPALRKVSAKPGESYEYTNKSRVEGSIEVYAADADSTSFDYTIYSKNGDELESSISANCNMSLKVPEGGHAVLSVNPSSKPVEFGGASELFTVEASSSPALGTEVTPAEEQPGFQYNRIEAAGSEKEVLNVVADDFSKLSDEQKQDDEIKEKAALFAEYAIEKTSTKELTIENNRAEINFEAVRLQAKEAKALKSEIEQIMERNNIGINREIEASIKVKIDGQPGTVAAVINNDLIGNLSGVDSIKIDTGEVIAVLRIDKLKDDIGKNNEGLTLEISKELEVAQGRKMHLAASNVKLQTQDDSRDTVNQIPVYHVGFKRGEKSVAKLNNNIKLAFPVSKSDPEYNCVFITEDESGRTAEPVGGKYVQISGKIEIESKKPGKYYVKENKKSFKDIESKDVMMKKAIEIMASKGVINGRNSNNFDPDGRVSRAEFVKLIVRTLYSLDKDAKVKFKDISKTAWYYQYVASASKDGLINGYPDNTFRGKGIITKQEIIKVCSSTLHGKKRYKYPADIGKYLAFNDAKSIPQWVKRHLALAVRERLVTKRADGKFQGSKPMTRGETALVLYRLFQKM